MMLGTTNIKLCHRMQLNLCPWSSTSFTVMLVLSVNINVIADTLYCVIV